MDWSNTFDHVCDHHQLQLPGQWDKTWETSVNALLPRWYLILPVGQVHCKDDSFIQLLRGHDFGHPWGSHVLVVHITERMGIEVQPQHSVSGGVLHPAGDAVPVNGCACWIGTELRAFIALRWCFKQSHMEPVPRRAYLSTRGCTLGWVWGQRHSDCTWSLGRTPEYTSIISLLKQKTAAKVTTGNPVWCLFTTEHLQEWAENCGISRGATRMTVEQTQQSAQRGQSKARPQNSIFRLVSPQPAGEPLVSSSSVHTVCNTSPVSKSLIVLYWILRKILWKQYGSGDATISFPLLSFNRLPLSMNTLLLFLSSFLHISLFWISLLSSLIKASSFISWFPSSTSYWR